MHLERFAGSVDRFNTRVGQAISWVWPLLVLIIVANVTLRYVFSIGSIELEEIQWHLFAAAFLLGYAYTAVEDAHVRVDIFYAAASERRKAWIDLLGCIFLLIPFAGFLTWYSIPYVLDSWALNERSEMPSGLPARYVIKAILSISLFMLLVQGIAIALRKALFLAGYGARRL